MASSPRSPHEDHNADGGAVCCMCGDHGLPGELFRCRCCRARLQHRYCSDLYPRATAYRRCNWCLRAPAAQLRGGGAAHATAAASKPAEKRKPTAVAAAAAATAAWVLTTTTPASVDEGHHRQQQLEGCSRRPPPAELGRPVKKHKANERAPPSPPSAAVGGLKGNDPSKKVMQAGKTPARVKVRRYKLLAEVISC
ncbi:hypothetical protein ACP4OV_024289 [Aristida adscensionis]